MYRFLGNFDPPVRSSIEPAFRSLTNQLDRYDVNDDGRVTPLDALLVINSISKGITDATPSQSPRIFGTIGTKFLDVDGDGRVQPLDALRVINHLSRLNRFGSNPEGELANRQNAGTAPGLASYAASVDNAFMVDEDDDRISWLDTDPKIDGARVF